MECRHELRYLLAGCCLHFLRRNGHEKKQKIACHRGKCPSHGLSGIPIGQAIQDWSLANLKKNVYHKLVYGKFNWRLIETLVNFTQNICFPFVSFPLPAAQIKCSKRNNLWILIISIVSTPNKPAKNIFPKMPSHRVYYLRKFVYGSNGIHLVDLLLDYQLAVEIFAHTKYSTSCNYLFICVITLIRRIK